MQSVIFDKIDIENIECIKPILNAFTFKPYSYYPNISSEKIVKFLYDDILTSIRSQDSVLFAAKKNDSIIGIAFYTKLPWESNILKINVASIKYLCTHPEISGSSDIIQGLIDEVVRYGRQEGDHLLVCKTNTKDIVSIHSLENRGFILMDTLLDYTFDFRKIQIESVKKPNIVENFQILLASDNDIDQLVRVAHSAFSNHFGRFNVDEKIPHEKGILIYEEWIKSCVKGWADFTIIAKIDNKIVGYSAWKKPSVLEQKLEIRIGHYSICGIDPEYSGLGLFGTLTHEGMSRLSGFSDIIEGPTHINNYPVQKSYTKLGWSITSAHHSFHKWLD